MNITLLQNIIYQGFAASFFYNLRTLGAIGSPLGYFTGVQVFNPGSGFLFSIDLCFDKMIINLLSFGKHKSATTASQPLRLEPGKGSNPFDLDLVKRKRWL
nr:hypothetical protein [uncultured Pedobacter sp.]